MCYDTCVKRILLKGERKVTGYLILFLVLLVVFGIQSYNTNKARKEKLLKELDENWGCKASRKYKHQEYERISHFYEKTKEPEGIYIDDITWNDVSMDDVFKAMNHTYSSVGEENLYRRLRVPEYHQEKLEKFGDMTAFFEAQPNVSKRLQEIFASIGRTKSVSLYDFILAAADLQAKSNLRHWCCIAGLLLSLAGLFVIPQYAVIVFFAMLSYNIYSYYKEKNDVNSYFTCFEYIFGLLRYGEKLHKVLTEADTTVLREDMDKVQVLLDKTKHLKKGMFLISSSNVNDSIVEMVMQYVRMIFHVDLIKFNSVVKKTSENIEDIRELYLLMGDVESAIAVASFRTYLKKQYGTFAIPQFTGQAGISFEEIYHPLIPNAVKNSMKEEENVLLTGSNASGKSTFLKTVAINGILAQTIYTATAATFVMPRVEVISSMALKDNLSQNDSYYMAEIKSLKRILDRAEQGRGVLCFIDEVLRGTNTIERIAASSEILKKLKQNKTICFAATHDIELTYILESVYSNYHFEEEVSGEDVRFNYHLNSGRTVTRNAIRLLKVLQYPDSIVSGAVGMVEEFTRTGKWSDGN